MQNNMTQKEDEDPQREMAMLDSFK